MCGCKKLLLQLKKQKLIYEKQKAVKINTFFYDITQMIDEI